MLAVWEAASRTSIGRGSIVKPVIVRWIDSMRTPDWRGTEDALAELHKPDHLDVESCGFLVGETDDRLMLALNRNPSTVGETIIIPKAAITARRELRAR